MEVRGLDSLRYQTNNARPQATDSRELLFVKLRYKEPNEDVSKLMDLPVMDRAGSASEDFRFASAVAAWGMLLRDSEYCADFDIGDVIQLARNAVGADKEGYRSEFVRLVETAQIHGAPGEGARSDAVRVSGDGARGWCRRSRRHPQLLFPTPPP